MLLPYPKGIGVSATIKNMKNLLQHTDSFEKLEELPIRERKKLGGDKWGRYKGRDYPYNKVIRFLRSRLGRNWDDVFSEFVHFDWIKDEDKTREKIGWAVITNTFLKGDKVYYYDNRRWCFFSNRGDVENGNEIPINSSTFYNRESFYVHPKTKKLCLLRQKPQPKPVVEKTLVILGDYHQLVKIKGIWYEIEGEPVKSNIIVIDGLHYKKVKHAPTIGVYETLLESNMFGGKLIHVKQDDHILYKIVNGEIFTPATNIEQHQSEKNIVGPRDCMIDFSKQESYWRNINYSSVKITRIRQLNHKDLTKYGLKNDVKPIPGKRCEDCGKIDCTLTHNIHCPICGVSWCNTHRKYDKSEKMYYEE